MIGPGMRLRTDGAKPRKAYIVTRHIGCSFLHTRYMVNRGSSIRWSTDFREARMFSNRGSAVCAAKAWFKGSPRQVEPIVLEVCVLPPGMKMEVERWLEE